MPRAPLPLRNFRAFHLLDGAEMKVVGSVVGGVDRRLLGANVVRPHGQASVPDPLRDQPASSEEIDKGERREGH